MGSLELVSSDVKHLVATTNTISNLLGRVSDEASSQDAQRHFVEDDDADDIHERSNQRS